MRTITKITPQKKNRNRLNVFLDGSYAFSVSDETYVEFHLYKGKQISDKELDDILEVEKQHSAYALALRYLSYRMRTEKEVRQYLVEKEIEPFYIDRAIARLQEEKLLDDRLFAEAFVRDRIHRSTKGPQLIFQELKEKGVGEETIHQALSLYTREKQVELAYKQAEKTWKKGSRYPFQKRLERVKNALIRKGFSSSLAQEVVGLLPTRKDDEEEWYLLKKEGDKLYNRYQKKYVDSFELRMRVKQSLYRKGFSLEQIDRYLDSLE